MPVIKTTATTQLLVRKKKKTNKVSKKNGKSEAEKTRKKSIADILSKKK